MAVPIPPCSAPEHSQFDFWLGEWSLSWPAEQSGGKPGGRGEGSNRIERLFGNCVISENFETSDAGFRGHSVSVFDERMGLWRQTWVDSSGAFLYFTGGLQGDTMELRTDPVERESETVLNRMVFKDIEPNSLRWEWQGSRDGGETWDDLWTIDYVRER